MEALGYESLAAVLEMAFERSARGKGFERHACGRPFDRQPILEIARTTGPGGPAYQIMKKAQEALRLDSTAARKEILDIIVYAAAWHILMEEQEHGRTL